MRFEEQDRSKRAKITLGSIADRRTMIERWANLTYSQSLAWEHRAEQAAKRLNGCLSIVDIGCGKMLLRDKLCANVSYIPLDIVARDSFTVIVDLNKELIPDNIRAEAVSVLGVIEYLYDVDAFFCDIRSKFEIAVVTYSVVDLVPDPGERLGNGWINSLSVMEFEATLTRAGWEIINTEQLDNNQMMWHLIAKKSFATV
jgi:hypothetical protein